MYTMQKTTPLLLQVIRVIKLLFHVISGVLQSLVYPYFPQHIRRSMMQRWATGVLACLEIRLQCCGSVPAVQVQRVLLAANHVSWLDVCVLMAACPTRFVAKAEISQWPVLGLLSRNVGTLFIERAKRSDTQRINQQIAEALENGEVVTVFPEGTTTDGSQLNHFHASLLQSAVNADALLYPAAIRYCNVAGGICREAAYIDSSLIVSLQNILSQPRIEAALTFTPPVPSGLRNRRELARLAEHAIAEVLAVPIRKESEKFSGLPSE